MSVAGAFTLQPIIGSPRCTFFSTEDGGCFRGAGAGSVGPGTESAATCSVYARAQSSVSELLAAPGALSPEDAVAAILAVLIPHTVLIKCFLSSLFIQKKRQLNSITRNS